jgi:hypothetical protein
MTKKEILVYNMTIQLCTWCDNTTPVKIDQQ